ncbi:MAG: M23 family metallopeptidase [Oscillospiraceae bacterium]|nr:M23 family metallopeptidase [Oscillospiraceae bacterium]
MMRIPNIFKDASQWVKPLTPVCTWLSLSKQFKETKESLRHRALPRLLTVSIILSLFTVLLLLYTPAYSVNLEGQTLGVIADAAVYAQASASAQEALTRVLGASFEELDAAELSVTIASKDELVTSEELANSMLEQVNELQRGYVLYIDEEAVGFSASQETLQALLDEMKTPYQTENTISATFAGSVSIRYDYTALSTPSDSDAVRAKLTANREEAITYTVVQGDTFSEIAERFTLWQNELRDLNPSVTPDKLSIGEVLIVKQAVPALSVITVENSVYEEGIPAPVEYVDDNTLYIGDSRIVDAGSAGIASVEAEITYQNGVEKTRNILGTTTKVEATTRIVARGTQKPPKTASKGAYIWPVNGKVTSTTGNRTLLGSTGYHSGLDIAVPYGTEVKAADGGTVTFSGWKGNYGNLVTITHDNGTQTYYAHNSELLVSKGDKVYQGQAIAKAGSTGRSTGNHCHFEVRVNGKTMNPYDYL